MISHYEPEADKEYHLHFKHTDEITIEAHFHKNIELLFLTEGTLSLTVGGKSLTLQTGEGAFIRPYEVHSYGNEKINAWVLVISDEYLKSYRRFYCKNGVERFPAVMLRNLQANGEILSLFEQWNGRKEYNHFETQGWINVILARIMQYYPPEKYIRDKSDTFAVEALSYINEHYSEDINLDTLAQTMGYSHNYCSTLFNRYVGENFNDYLNGVRVKKALTLIGDGNTVDFSIGRVGFTNRSTFYRAYNKLKSKKT